MKKNEEENNKLPDEVVRYKDNPDGFFDAEEYFNVADYYEGEIDVDSAIAVIRRGLSAYPNDIALRYEFARLHIVAGDLIEAERLFNVMLEDSGTVDSEDILGIKLMLAKIHIERCDFISIDKEVKQVNSWIKGVSDDAAIDSFLDFATSFYQCFMYSYAIDILKKGHKRFPDNIHILESLIECYVKDKSDYKSGIKYCEKALDVAPYNEKLWFKLGWLHRYSDNYKEAINAFDYATSINAKAYDAWHAMGDCYVKLENYERACECYLKVLSKKNPGIKDYNLVADMYNYTDKFSKAREYYNKSLDIDEDNAEALFGIGMSYFLDSEDKETNASRAVYWIKRALNEDSDNEFYWLVLGECYFITDNWGHAIFAYHRALDINPSQSSAFVKLGQAYCAIGDYDEAIFHLNKAKLLDPDSRTVAISLAITYYFLKEYTNAKYYLMHAIRQDSSADSVFLSIHPHAKKFVENVKKLV
ncbi:MAG: tetratricopeptide repeat protein [Paludibacteraceae bacterium]|nr:tetratricopeptide repeat protein [Paludibacteraceae bacterium]